MASEIGHRGPEGEVVYLVCSRCGIGRQKAILGQEEVSEYYRSKYYREDYTHTFQQDLEVARLRHEHYQISRRSRLLDVGCGNGAFLKAFADRHSGAKVECVGVDPADVRFNKFLDVYVSEFEQSKFPTELFDVVTCHDVVEHSINPMAFLKELFRVVTQNGIAYVEIPDYTFKHHWKAVEHLWMFDEEQFSVLLTDVGFDVETIEKPVESKWLFKCRKPVQARKSLLIPNGIGDALWCLTKIQGFLESIGEDSCDLYVASHGGNPNRTLPYVRKVPFVKAEGYCKMKLKHPAWKRMYWRSGPTLFENVFGCDYFLGYNGILRHGRRLEEVDVIYGCNWDFPVFRSSYERRCEQRYKESHGDYVAVHFIDSGAYHAWAQEFPVEEMNKALRRLSEAGLKIVLFGHEYDSVKTADRILEGTNHENLIGKTNLDQVFALLHGSKAVLGFPVGVTMIQTTWDTPTVLLWNKHFKERMWWNSVPARTHNVSYKAMDTAKTNGVAAADALLGMMK